MDDKSSKKNSKDIVKEVKKRVKFNRATANKIEKSDVQTACSCPHQNNGHFTITPAGKKDADGNMLYQCTTCMKIINITAPAEDKVKDAIAMLDRSCDVIKMLSNMNNPKDEKIYRKVSKLQYKLTKFMDYYYGAKLNSKNKKGGSKNKNSKFEDGWERTRFNR